MPSDLTEQISIIESLENKISNTAVSQTKMKNEDIKRYRRKGQILGTEDVRRCELVMGIKEPPLRRGSLQLVFDSGT